MDSVLELGVEWVTQNRGVRPWDLRGVDRAHEKLSLEVSLALCRSGEEPGNFCELPLTARTTWLHSRIIWEALKNAITWLHPSPITS